MIQAEKHGKAWGRADLLACLSLREKGKSYFQIAQELNRSVSAVAGALDRIRIYGLPDSKNKRKAVISARIHANRAEQCLYNLQAEQAQEARRQKALTLTDFLGE